MRRSLWIVLIALFVVAVSARADSIVDVALGSGTCCQSITATFNWDVTTSTMVPNTMYATGSGQLGSFTYLDESGYSAQGYSYFLFNFQDSSGDIATVSPYCLPPEAQVEVQCFPDLGSYPLNLSISCATSTDACSTDGYYGHYLLQGNMDVVQTPEPSTLMLLLSAAGFLGVFSIAWRRCVCPPIRRLG